MILMPDGQDFQGLSSIKRVHSFFLSLSLFFFHFLLYWLRLILCDVWKQDKTEHALPVSVTRQTRSPNKVCRLTPMDRARASTPPEGQWPAGWQLHTLTVRVLVLERAGEPLSVTTTGRRYWVRSLRVKVLLRATMPAVLSESGENERCTLQWPSRKHE